MPKLSQDILPYNDYSRYIKRRFGKRVQKISVDAGFTCPNRDGTKSTGACIYCANESFSPFYCNPKISITEQLLKGIEFFSPKYKTQEYLAYFQSYTNTYSNIELLKEKYSEALDVKGICGLVIATRPDCINEEILEMITNLGNDKYVAIEYGVESTKDDTLNFINRGHSWSDTIKAIKLTAKFKINIGVHLILGLPGENHNDFMVHAERISKLPINFLKIHQLQILKNTPIEKIFKETPELFIDLSLENYVKIVVDFVERLNPNIIIERFTGESPLEMIIYPRWEGKKNYEITHLVVNELKRQNSYQGKLYSNEIF